MFVGVAVVRGVAAGFDVELSHGEHGCAVFFSEDDADGAFFGTFGFDGSGIKAINFLNEHVGYHLSLWFGGGAVVSRFRQVSPILVTEIGLIGRC